VAETKGSKYPFTLDPKRVGSVIKTARENLRYSFRELSGLCGVSPTQLMRIESGEYEYSMEKCFRVCISLGLAIAEVIDYATQRDWVPEASMDMIPNYVRDALGTKHKGKLLQKLLERHDRYGWNIFYLAAIVLTSVNPVDRIRRTGFPTPELKKEFEDFATMSQNLSNVERITLLHALRKEPVQKLFSLGLLSESGAATFAEGDKDWRIDYPIPWGIYHTLKHSAKLSK
jgi:transcriptional regulator with XRE-family HTH domain